MTTKSLLKERAEIRSLAMQLSIAAIEHYALMPDYGYNPDYDELWEACQCADRGHRKKSCPLGKEFDKHRCMACRGTKPLGAMYCDACLAEMDRVMRARAEKVKELRHMGQRAMLLSWATQQMLQNR